MFAVKTAFVGLVSVVFVSVFSSCSSVVATEPEPLATEPRWSLVDDVYRELEAGEGTIEISLQEQTLVLRDERGRIAIETDCSTGIPGRETPVGNFSIQEMKVDKRSNKYGKYIDRETGEVVVEKSWEVPRRPAGTAYLGIAMPYWMRLTWDGVGIHVGQFPRGARSSFGCVRMPASIQPLIYRKSRSGMRVVIRD